MKSPTQRHFDFMILLMCGFFAVYYGTETYNSYLEHRTIDPSVAEDAFRTLFGVALGMFRGMLPDKEDSTNESKKTS